MADAELLRDLRERVLDESESLAGLLRTCLALGAVTGSDALRSWASRELKGYKAGVEVPDYRKLRLPLYVDSISLSNVIVRQHSVSRYMAPADAQHLIPQLVPFKDSLDHLSEMAESEGNYQIRLESLKFAAAKWNGARRDGEPEISDLYYMVSAAAIRGMVGVVRTSLVEMVLDMAKDVPLDQLPTRRQVDTAVQVYIDSSQDNSMNFGGSNYGVAGQNTETQTQHPR